MGMPTEVCSDERLGRAVFNKSDRGTQPRSRFFKGAFNEEGLMSVDRLDHACLAELCRIHDVEAENRRGPSSFHGWWTFRADLVGSKGGSVRYSPTPDNRWHADVVWQGDRDDLFMQMYQSLKEAARWESRPTPDSQDGLPDS